jgi:hypothetical protein
LDALPEAKNTREEKAMEPDEVVVHSEESRALWRNVLLAIAGIYVIVSLYFIFDTRREVSSVRQDQQAAIDKLTDQVSMTNRDLKTSSDALAQRLGMTQQELQDRMAARAAALQKQQEESAKRLAQEQQSSFNQVNGEVAGVKTDLGSTQTDLAATKTDLQSTEAKLDRTMGDLGVQSGLIAHTRDELTELEHRGDRNYYEFTLQRGAHPTPVSTISLALKKSDPKHSKFTINVIADDRTIEKKDRSVAEPMQFYTGRNRTLDEVVIFTVDKNKVTGYLSTPKAGEQASNPTESMAPSAGK